MRLLIVLFFAIQWLAVCTAQQFYEGPWHGTAPAGTIVTTDTFDNFFRFSSEDGKRYKKAGKTWHQDADRMPGTTRRRYDGFEAGVASYQHIKIDRSTGEDSPTSYLLNEFAGMEHFYDRRPDTYIAAGPGHIITVINTRFEIHDKNGTLQKSIYINHWYNKHDSLWIYDPKVIYNEFLRRWIMVWLANGTVLLSVSENENPLGRWVNRDLPESSGPTSTSTDYQGFGYDQNAVYITPHMFSRPDHISLPASLRIISNAQLTAAAAEPITFTDYWNFTNPADPGKKMWNIRPSRMHDSSAVYYLAEGAGDSNSIQLLIKISYSGAVPQLSYGVCQLNPNTRVNGALVRIENSTLMNEPEVRDNRLYLTRMIQNPANSSLIAARFASIDLNGVTPVQDIIIGHDSLLLTYPALAIDKRGNCILTCSVSDTGRNYSFAFLTKRAEDTVFSGMRILHASENPLEGQLYSDYTGAWLDPENQTDFWIYGAYSKAAWAFGTWIGKARTGLLNSSGLSMLAGPSFPVTIAGSASAAQNFTLCNLGTGAVTIDSARFLREYFSLSSGSQVPAVLHEYDSLSLNISFTPKLHGINADSLRVFCSNGNVFSFPFSGTGFLHGPIASRQAYGITADNRIININKYTGVGILTDTVSGLPVSGFALHPKTKNLFGIITNSSTKNQIIHIRGDGEYLAGRELNMSGLTMAAFDSAGTLYAAKRNGALYRLNLSNGSAEPVCSIKTQINSLVFNHSTNELWGTVYAAIGKKDVIFKINTLSGDTNVVGRTGFNYMNYGLFFDETGAMYGVNGPAANSFNLISINTNNGAGTIIGNTGFPDILSIAYNTQAPVSVNGNKTQLAGKDLVSSVYPNPSNMSAKIEYRVGAESYISIVIYDIRGRRVAALLKEKKAPGKYTQVFNAQDLASGVYFCRIVAEPLNNSGRIQTINKIVMVK